MSKKERKKERATWRKPEELAPRLSLRRFVASLLRPTSTVIPASKGPNRKARRRRVKARTFDDKPANRHGQRRRSKRVAGNKWRARRNRQ